MAVHLIRIEFAVISAAVSVLELPQPLLHALQHAAAVHVTLFQDSDLRQKHDTSGWAEHGQQACNVLLGYSRGC